MIIDKNAIEKIPQFSIGDEVVLRKNGSKRIVVFQDDTAVTTWYPSRRKSTLGYEYLSPCMQVYDAYAIKKTGKIYPEFTSALKEVSEGE